jgi:hypothetical protein
MYIASPWITSWITDHKACIFFYQLPDLVSPTFYRYARELENSVVECVDWGSTDCSCSLYLGIVLNTIQVSSTYTPASKFESFYLASATTETNWPRTLFCYWNNSICASSEHYRCFLLFCVSSQMLVLQDIGIAYMDRMSHEIFVYRSLM